MKIYDIKKLSERENKVNKETPIKTGIIKFLSDYGTLRSLDGIRLHLKYESCSRIENGETVSFFDFSWVHNFATGKALDAINVGKNSFTKVETIKGYVLNSSGDKIPVDTIVKSNETGELFVCSSLINFGPFDKEKHELFDSLVIRRKED